MLAPMVPRPMNPICIAVSPHVLSGQVCDPCGASAEAEALWSAGNAVITSSRPAVADPPWMQPRLCHPSVMAGEAIGLEILRPQAKALVLRAPIASASAPPRRSMVRFQSSLKSELGRLSDA